MFRGNKMVLILPALLMGFIFWGGYYYLGQASQLTNEELSTVTFFEIDYNQVGSNVKVIGNWNWVEMPIDGLNGTDYIGVSFPEITDLGIPISEIIKSSIIELHHGDKVLYEAAGEYVKDGIVFPFPNKLLEHESYGNVGTFQLVMEKTEGISRLSASYLHTWTEHDGLQLEDARFLEPAFVSDAEVGYWVMERFLEMD